MTTTTSPSSSLPLKGRTARIRHLCPYHYLVREDFLFGTREGLTPRAELKHHIEQEIMPASETILSYDLISGQPLPWMQDKGWNEGYAYLLFYCTTHDPFLQKCFMEQTSWSYGHGHTTRRQDQDQGRQADREQYEALRVLVRDSLQQSDLLDRAEQMPVHEPEPTPLPEFIIRRRGTHQDIVPAAPLPPTSAPLPTPTPTRPVQQRKQYEQEEEPDEAKNFLIAERQLMNLISGWRGRER